jgi:hypothetical protein
MRHAVHAWILSCGGLLAAAGHAADEVPPDEALLEFLGSWSGEDGADDWFDFLESLPRTGPAPAIEPGPVEADAQRSSTDEPR